MGQVWLHYCKLKEHHVNGIRQSRILLLFVREVRPTLLKKTHQKNTPAN